MIDRISIRNFATIEDVDIEFHKGLNVITGETGAGKSVLIEAISLALGSRADKTFVRTGCDRAEIKMLAEVNNKEITVNREISSDGRNTCKIDGQNATLTQLSDISTKIADIYGQYDNQTLLNPANHIYLVDLYEKGATAPMKKRVSELYDEYLSINKHLKTVTENNAELDRKKEFMQYEIDEITKANLIPGEDDRMHEQLEIMKNQEKLYDALQSAYENTFPDENSALDKLSASQNHLRDVSNISKDAARLEDEFSDLYYRLEDLGHKLREIKDSMVFNQTELDDINERLSFVESLKRKYDDTIDGINEHAENLKKQITNMSLTENEIEGLQIEASRIKEMLNDESERLSRTRKNSAMTLEGKIQEELENLNFHDVNISINFSKLPDFTSDGIDKVEFLISTNKGEDMRPLAKIASGGEMSRIMLAFKKIIGDYDGISTMIFDEIDSGISGETAMVVGKVMSQIGTNHQLITITHLPQIAAYGDHNYRIEKSSDDSRTYTTISHLSDKEKTAEIARLISGINISDITMQSAIEMINYAK